MNTTGIEIIDRTLVSYSGTEPKVIIDSDILAIADRAFYQNEKIESIVVNSPSLRTIGKEAFCGCRRLSEAKFSAIKGGIALSAFEGCSALRCFVIPNGIMEIGSGAFRRCAAHFVLQIPSSVDVIGDNIVDSSAIIVSASPNEEISKYGDKNRIAVKKDLNTVLKQLETRRLIEREGEERQFNIFGESITASNTLRIYQEVLEYYQREKQRLIDLALAGLPTQLSLSTAQKDAFLGVLESVNNGTKTLIKRVERWGIILPESTTFIDVLLPAAKLAKCGNLIIQGLTEGKNIADEMISDARDTLANEAESRVTGLSYGMLGSGLDMVLYSIDDFRERQRQRKAAYEEADRKLHQYASQTNSFANQQFAKLMKETAIPVFLSAISECCDALQKAELDTLKNEDLLVGTEPDIDDIVKSSKIIESALSDSSRDKEYSIALALKKCPFNKGAYSIAANNGLATDTLLALFAHVGLADENGNNISPDTQLLAKMVKPDSVTVEGLSEFCNNATVFGGAMPNSVAEIVKSKLEKLLSDAILPKLSMPYDGNNKQQITSNAISAASKWVSKKAASDLDHASISIADCASHIANKKIRDDQAKTYEVTLAAINTSASLSDDISIIKASEAVIGELSAANLLHKSISKCEKKLTALVENHAVQDIEPTIEQLKNELTDVINENDLAVIHSKGEVVLQSSPASIDELIDILQRKIEITRNRNAENEKKYIIACDLQEKAQSADDYEKVAVLFDELTLYKDSTARQVECIKKQQERQEKAYASAKSALEKAKSKKALDAVAKQFSVISNYKDSNKYLSEIENRKKAIKNKKTGLLLGFIGIVIIAAVVYYTQVIVPGNKYKAADVLFSTGQYEEAIEAFETLGSFKDSPSRIEEVKNAILAREYAAAEALLKAGEYEEAIRAFEALGNYSNSAAEIERAKEAIRAAETEVLRQRYAAAEALLAKGQYNEATTAFEALGSFEDSQERVKESMYAQAEVLLQMDKRYEAAVLFGRIAGYKDAATISLDIWRTIAHHSTIAAGYNHTVAVRNDGTVVATGNNSYGCCDIGSWKNVISVKCSQWVTVGLTEEGTILYAGKDADRFSFSSWSDIVEIALGDGLNHPFVAGLKSDGTIVISGDLYRIDDEQVGTWNNIIHISASGSHIAGLKPDGSIIWSGDNRYGELRIRDWDSLQSIFVGSTSVGVKTDGTVLATGFDQRGECNISKWNNVVYAESLGGITVGLTSDNRLIFVGTIPFGMYGSVWDAENIVGFSLNYYSLIAITSDGTVLAAGRGNDGECDVNDWTDIRLPD